MKGTSHTFDKLERLTHQASIDAIFQKKGKSIFKPPILLVYYESDLHTPFPCQILVSVGKRKFKRAVDRNRIKRQILAIYRTQKKRIYDIVPSERQFALGILFLGTTKPTHKELDSQLKAAIDEFIKRVE